MHFCLLVGYGAGAINPYLAYATLAGMIRRRPPARTHRRRGASIISSRRVDQEPDQGRVEDGHLDDAELSRRADFRSDRAEPRGYRQVLHLDGVARRRRRPRGDRARVRAAASARASRSQPNLDGELDVGGQYQWRRRGEFHMYNPNTIAKLQHSVRSGNYRLFKDYTRLVDDHSRNLATLRGLLKFKPERAAGADRRGRAGAARSSSASRPARCRSDRSARRRTRTSRSR